MAIFGANGFAGILERVIGGRSAMIGQDALDLQKKGFQEDIYGRDLTNEGLGNLRNLASQYQNQINNGGLPDDLRRQFNVMRGGLADDATRLQRSFLANMQQKLLSQPTFNPNAAAEYDLENQKNTGEQLFTSTNDLNFGESKMALDNTNKLFDRLDAIGQTFVGTGQSERDRALKRISTSLEIRFSRNKAIADTIAKIMGGMKGGGGLSAGGGG